MLRRERELRVCATCKSGMVGRVCTKEGTHQKGGVIVCVCRGGRRARGGGGGEDITDKHSHVSNHSQSYRIVMVNGRQKESLA